MMAENDQYYVRFRGRTLGPLSTQKIHDLVRRGQVTRMHELSLDGAIWRRADEFPEFFAGSVTVGLPSTPPSASPPVATNPVVIDPPSSKLDSSSASLSENVPSTHDPPTIFPPSGNQPTSTPEPRRESDPDVAWYAHVDNRNQGPMPRKKLESWVASGALNRNTLVWRSGLDSWQTAGKVLPELFAVTRQRVLDHSAAPDPYAPDAIPGKVSDDLFNSMVGEFHRRRGWALFLAVFVMIVSLVWIGISSFAMLRLTQEELPEETNAGWMVVGTISSIALACTTFAGSILLMRYCSSARTIARRPCEEAMITALQRLNLLWTYAGLACLSWTVIFILMIFSAIVLSLRAST